MRHNTTRAQRAVPAEIPADILARPLPLNALAAGLLGWVLLTLLCAPPVLADPTDQVDPMLLAALPAAIHLSVADRPLAAKAASVAQTRDRTTHSKRPSIAASTDPKATPSMIALSDVPWRAPTTDEVLAAAVARGPSPDLEPEKPFRKRSHDLFRAERPVEIGNAQMLLRLRLRAKSREAMSVELHF